MPRHGPNNSLTVAEGRAGHSSLDAVVDRTNTAPWQMTHIVLAAFIAVLFVSALALKPVAMAGFPALCDLSADACSDMLDDAPTPPDIPFLPATVEHPQRITPATTVASLDRLPILGPRLVSFPELPQGPPART